MSTNSYQTFGPHRQQAMTLIELLIVLAIVAVLLGLGVAAMISLRDTSITKQATDEFVQNIIATRNLARNSVVSIDPGSSSLDDDIALATRLENLDHYAIVFAEDNYYRATCRNEGSFVRCNRSEVPLKTNLYEFIAINPVNLDEDNCTAIIFDLSTGRFQFGRLGVFASGSAQVDITPVETVSTCQYEISHPNPTINLNVQVDAGTWEINLI